MTKITIIVAVDGNMGIGYKDELLFNYDMKHFVNSTKGKCVVMGMKTFKSIGKPLPNRRNIVLSNSNTKIDGVEVMNFNEFLEIKDSIETEIMIIGGSSIYELFDENNLVDELLMTFYNESAENVDAYFKIDGTKYHWVDEVLADEKYRVARFKNKTKL